MVKWFLTVILKLLFGLFLTTSLIFAQVVPAPDPSPPASDLASSSGSDSLKAITKIVDAALGANLVAAFKNAGLGIAGGLMGGARIIAGSLALATILWIIVISLVKNESVLPGVTEELIYAIITAALLGWYAQIVNDIVGLGEWVLATTGGSLRQAVVGFVDGMMAKIIDVIVKGFQNVVSLKGWLLGGAIDWAISILLLLVATYFMVIALLELIGVVLAGPVVIGIAVALGPLFIASFASQWTRRWFNQWINFFVNGAMLTAMVVVVLTLINNVVVRDIGLAPSGFLAGEALALALLAAGMGKIFSSIPSLADGLFPGRTGAGSASAGAKVFTSAPKTAMSGAASTAQGVASGGSLVASAGQKVLAAANMVKNATRVSNLG